ncbi:MAG: HEAT repeat domain-containing protein [Isosphaeraceae bacterium]
MTRSIMSLACLAALLLAIPTIALGGDSKSSSSEQETKLIAVLKSSATQLEKSDACRELARIGTKAAVTPLADLLDDEKLAHMARYGLEPIPDPAVDEALRNAAAKLKGRLLIGVIGSIGVRRDAKAVDLLAGQLKSSDAHVMHAAARALGSIGNAAAAKALESVLADTPAPNRLAVSEGLFRCAEALGARGQRGESLAIYEHLNRADVPQQVREGAAKKVHALRQEEGPRY